MGLAQPETSSNILCMRLFHITIALCFLVTVVALPADAANGPYATFVDAGDGVNIDVDVRWPDSGTAPAAGWPVIFWAHGAGGTKNSYSGRATDFANDGYVTISYTNRPDSERDPENFANDIVALKAWLINDFESEAGVTVPVDPQKFGMSGNSLGGLTTWSGGLLTDAFATIVPFNWSMHAFRDYFSTNGSIERQTASPPALQVFPSLDYPAAETDQILETTFANALDAFADLPIPVMNHLAMLDSRTSGTVALTDHLALESASQRIVYLGTGGHKTPNDDGNFRDEMRRRWFDHHLKGEANGIAGEDPIQMALLVTNEKVYLPSWPPPTQQGVTVYLQEDATLQAGAPTGAQAADTFINDPGSFTWFDTPSFGIGDLRSQIPQEIVAYQTEPLTEEVLLIGQPSVVLHVAGTGSRYQVNVHLYDVPPSGDKALLAFGTATLAASPTTAEILLSVTGRRLPADHSLRLEITNRDDQDLDHSDGDAGFKQLRYTPFFAYSQTSIFHDTARPSSLTLPLIGRNDLPLPEVGCGNEANANCQLIRSTQFKITDDDLPPVNTRKRRLNFRSAKFRTNPSGVVEPAFGSAGDPTATGASGGGAVLTVYRVDGTLDDMQTYVLPASLWSQTGNSTRPGYRYKDNNATQGPIKKITIARGKLTVVGQGDGVYELAAAPQGAMAARLKLGSGLELCTATGARSPESRYDSTRKFEGLKNSAAPAACPDLPEASPYGSANLAFLLTPGSLLD